MHAVCRSPNIEGGVSLDRLLGELQTLSSFGRNEGLGINRPSYSKAYVEAVNWLCDAMRASGMSVRVDAVGNVIGRIGPPGSAVVCGSHIDTVPNAGCYDGTLGILSAMECVRVLGEAGHVFARALEVIAFVDEEGAFLSLLGSRAMTGNLRKDELTAAANFAGKSLSEAMRDEGYDDKKYHIAIRPLVDFAAYVELHIEQGPVLESTGDEIGIVTSVAGIVHTDFIFSGSADHAGTTPMAMRRDAFRAAAAFANRAFENLVSRNDPDARLTFGLFEMKPQAASIVPQRVRLRQELRHTCSKRLSVFTDASRELADSVGERAGVTVNWFQISRDEPHGMSKPIQDLIADVCQELGLRALRMPSGAGHDAQTFASVCPTGMIFVPSTGGKSHCPEEHTGPGSILDGVKVLLETLRRLTSGPIELCSERN